MEPAYSRPLDVLVQRFDAEFEEVDEGKKS